MPTLQHQHRASARQYQTVLTVRMFAADHLRTDDWISSSVVIRTWWKEEEEATHEWLDVINNMFKL